MTYRNQKTDLNMIKIFNKVPIVGLVRYSQKITFQGGDKDVFESSYFEYRYKIFMDVTLKSFEDQSNKNFLLVIIHSETMPQKYKDRFVNLEVKYPFLKNYFLQDTAESLKNLLLQTKNLIDFRNRSGLTFRIDNDDAVPTNFIENLCLFLNPPFVGSCINLPNILIVKRVQTDKYLIERRYFPSNSMGLAYVTSENNFKTILDINEHHIVNENNNLILLPKSSGIPLQTINGENAINAINDDASVTFTEKHLQEFLKVNNYDTINLKCLKILTSKKRNSIKTIINLLTPPIFKAVAYKISKFVTNKK